MHTFKDPRFHDETAARHWFEAARWPHGPICPHCGTIKPYATKKKGRYRCSNRVCRKDYTVTTKSVMESSHVPLTQWATAFYLMNSSKKGISALQLQRSLGCQYKTAWFMHHRVREAMREGGLDVPPLGGGGHIVEADETYFGGVESAKMRTAKTSGQKFIKSGKPGSSNKRAIVTLVERGGRARSFHVPRADAITVINIVRNNIETETRLHTDESSLYRQTDTLVRKHETVKHSRREYVRGDVHTNTVEGYFAIFKRGMRGVYQHCSEKHLHRYLAEFDFRYNHRAALGYSDEQRTIASVKAAEGKRLTYHQPR
jgi:transposase-like protein